MKRGDVLELDNRKLMILKAIIREYMDKGEPIGSRTLSKLLDIKISSATIRNEMSDLEELGYIIQPHTSSGRIPSDKGYRFYVDEILKDKEEELIELKADVGKRIDRLEEVLRYIAKSVASNTEYAAMISAPNINKSKFKFLQLTRLDDFKILLVSVTDSNIIKNNILNTDIKLNDQDILNLNLLLNTNLNGHSIDEVNISLINKIRTGAGHLRDTVQMILDELAKVYLNEGSLNIYTSGADNIFKYPELSACESASKLINAFEEKSKLREILNDNIEKEHGAVQVYIGDELPIGNMNECSVVTASYELGEGLRGTIGIVGPKRMDYEKVLRAIKNVIDHINDELI